MLDAESLVERVPCGSAEELLEALSWRGTYFRSKEGAGSNRTYIDIMIFCGHSDSSYELVPTALREETHNPLRSFFIQPMPETEAEQARVELELLNRFFSLADFAGLPLPEDSQRLRRKLDYLVHQASDRGSQRALDGWPDPELLSLLAIGQHHGLPTRLLDWSRSPLTAAYFAAHGATTEVSECSQKGQAVPSDKTLSVWAFDYSKYVRCLPGPQFRTNLHSSRRGAGSPRGYGSSRQQSKPSRAGRSVFPLQSERGQTGGCPRPTPIGSPSS